MREDLKTCNRCDRDLPANTDYFYKKHDTKDGFTSACKECNGQRFTKYHDLKDGEMFCKRCEKILPYTDEYFPKDKSTKTGLRNVCYICSKGKGGSARYGKRAKPAPKWTKEEDDLLSQVYADNTNKEIAHLFPERTEKAITDRALLLGLSKSKIARKKQYENHSKWMTENCSWKGVPKTQEEKDRLSLLMKQRWENDYDTMLAYTQYERTPEQRAHLSAIRSEEGRWKGESNPRHINPLKGSENGNWKGGITPLLFWFRNQLDEWKKESMKHHNYTCVITGKNFDEIHHLHSFKSIIGETLENLELDYYKNLEEFTDGELETMRDAILATNAKYGLGVCLTKEVHKLFHDLYGYGDNTPEQFQEFSKRCKQGEFDNII